MGVIHWIFGKHPPRPADPRRSVGLDLMPRWQAVLVAQELASLGIGSSISDHQVSFRCTRGVEAGAILFVMEPDADLARSIIAEMEAAAEPEFFIRPSAPTDQEFLDTMLIEAIFTGDAEPTDAELDEVVANNPTLLRYTEAFGEWDGDLGWIAEDTDDQPIGAVWLRKFAPHDPGYGYVDATTPELSIAVTPDWRGCGVGSALLVAALDAAPRVSLSVDATNPARRLYARFGFHTLTDDGHTLTMIRESGS